MKQPATVTITLDEKLLDHLLMDHRLRQQVLGTIVRRLLEDSTLRQRMMAKREGFDLIAEAWEANGLGRPHCRAESLTRRSGPSTTASPRRPVSRKSRPSLRK